MTEDKHWPKSSRILKVTESEVTRREFPAKRQIVNNNFSIFQKTLYVKSFLFTEICLCSCRQEFSDNLLRLWPTLFAEMISVCNVQTENISNVGKCTLFVYEYGCHFRVHYFRVFIVLVLFLLPSSALLSASAELSWSLISIFPNPHPLGKFQNGQIQPYLVKQS